MMEEEFYASIKIVTGEEVFAKVCVCEEEGRTLLLLSHPVILDEVKVKKPGVRRQTIGYKVEPWLKTASDDMFILNMDRVVTLSESDNAEIINVYHQFLRDEECNINPNSSRSSLNREMGYISSVGEAKAVLEKIFNLKES
jgi:hypothetical protein